MRAFALPIRDVKNGRVRDDKRTAADTAARDGAIILAQQLFNIFPFKENNRRYRIWLRYIRARALLPREGEGSSTMMMSFLPVDGCTVGRSSRGGLAKLLAVFEHCEL